MRTLRRTRMFWALVFSWGAMSAVLGFAIPRSAAAQFNAGPVELENVFSAADRELRQALSRAEKSIEEGNFADAVEELGVLLQDGGSEDYFVGTTEKGQTRTSLKAEAERLLSQLPPRGRELYETKYGAEARQLLEESLKEGSIRGLTNVTRSYFQTKAGLEAAILLGRLQLDQGRPLAAALNFRRVSAVPGAKAAYDPELSLLLAVSWLQAQRPDDARQVLAGLAGNNAVIQVNAKPVKLFGAGEDSLAWLTKIAGAPAAARTPLQEQWVVFRGNEARNGMSEGGLPITDFRWRVLTMNDPRDEFEVKQIARRLSDQNVPSLPALQPLAVNDTIIMRTNECLIGVDFKTGKLIWEFRLFELKDLRNVVNTGASRANATAQRQFELQQRVWEDAAYGQVSSDGELVFVIEGLRPSSTPNQTPFIIANRRPIQNPGLPTNHNLLVALDIRQQGKLKWMVGGDSGEGEAALKDVFFLGAPLPLQGQLLVLGERKGQISLFVLDGATGKLEWSQQIAHMNESTVMVDVTRRLAGVSPTFSDGLVICPTAGGAVVAVDWAKRSLAWGYNYKRTAINQIGPRQFGAFANPPAQPVAAGMRWADSAIVVGNGCVVITPPDANELHCLDLLTGRHVFPPIDRKNFLENSLFVACIHDDNIVLVGKSSVVALKLKDGSAAWKKPIELNPALPTGRGIFTGSAYYLPLSTSEVIAIDLRDGSTLSRMKTAVPFGNLITHRDELISLNSDALTTFYLRDPLKKRIEDLLAKNPQDAWALARKGELLLQEGKRTEAIVLLRAAHKNSPDDESIRSSLVKMLLATLREDYKSAAGLAAEIEGLIDQPAQKAEFLRLTAQGLAEAKAYPEAFEAYLTLALLSSAADRTDSRTPAVLDDMDRNWRVRGERWLPSRLAALYAAANDESRVKLDAIVAARLGDENLTPERRLEFTRLFAFHPATQVPRLELATRLADAGSLLAAESEVWSPRKSKTLEIRGQATAILADVLDKAGRPHEAAGLYQRLKTEFAEAPVRAQKTGAEVFEAAKTQGSLKKYLDGSAWPGGKVNVLTDAQRDPRFLSYQRLLPIPITSHQGVEILGQQVTFDQSRGTIVVRDGLGRVVSEAGLKAGEGRYYFQQAMTGVSFGHLLVVSMGGEVIAIDTLKRTDAILWRQETTDRAPNPYAGYGGMQSRQIRNPLGGSRQVLSDQSGKPLLASIAVGPWGVCFQRNRNIVCVHPLTGEQIWERSSFEFGAELFGDEQYVFIVPTGGEQGERVEAVVVDAWDGSPIGKRKVDRNENRWAAYGRNVLSWSETNNEIRLRLADAFDDKELWTKNFAAGSRGCLISGEEAAVLEPSGELVIVGLQDGVVRLQSKVEAEAGLLGLFVLRSSNQYFVLTNHPSTEAAAPLNYHPAPAGANTQLLTGRVYAFDRSTGKTQWPSPAYVSQHGYVTEQPADLPVLLFLRHATPAKGSGAKTFTSVLCLDKRTGRALLDANEFPTPIHAYEVSADREKARMQVTVFGSSQRTYTLQFTDDPAPPEAPAQLGPMSSLRTDPPGIGVNIAADVFDALNNRRAPNPNLPPPPRPAEEDPFK